MTTNARGLEASRTDAIATASFEEPAQFGLSSLPGTGIPAGRAI